MCGRQIGDFFNRLLFPNSLYRLHVLPTSEKLDRNRIAFAEAPLLDRCEFVYITGLGTQKSLLRQNSLDQAENGRIT